MNKIQWAHKGASDFADTKGMWEECNWLGRVVFLPLFLIGYLLVFLLLLLFIKQDYE